MALPKSFAILALLALLLAAAWVVDSKALGSRPGSLRRYQCPNACTRRCSQTQYHKPCMFFCQKCCRKCLCVPSGFYGNKQTCPCYNNWKTKRGGPKCP
ncbi:hypothetical protein AMTRI_Chr04g253030 [Amborella trichopoda]